MGSGASAHRAGVSREAVRLGARSGAARHIGLEEIDDGIWSIYFGMILLARLDERDCIIRE